VVFSEWRDAGRRAAAPRALPRGIGGDESPTASANARKFATLDEPPNRRTRHPERTARLLDGDRLLRHGLDRIIKSAHCLIVSFPGESLTSADVLPPPAR
jgi:hypothetical protein